jgi:hypothetical protein
MPTRNFERKREALYVSVRFSFSWVLLLKFQNTLGLTPSCGSLLQEQPTKYMNLPYNMKPLRKISSNHFFVGPRPHLPSHTFGNHEHPNNRLNQILFFHLYVQF